MASLRQIAANRLNAMKSSGPVTADGKEQSRRNALDHGLTALVVLPDEEAAAVVERIEQWNSSLRPWDVYEMWLLEQVAGLTLRLERCQQHERILRDRSARRAALCWDDDRGAAVETLAALLASRPAEVAQHLKTSKHGCAWLIARWEALGRLLEAGGDWDDDRRRLALDLLGVPIELRDGPTPLDVSPGADLRAERRALVAGQVAGLRAKLAGALEDLDDLEREAAALGLGVDDGPSLRLLRRYERDAQRRLEWCMAQFKTTRPGPPPEQGGRDFSERPAYVPPAGLVPAETRPIAVIGNRHARRAEAARVRRRA